MSTTRKRFISWIHFRCFLLIIFILITNTDALHPRIIITEIIGCGVAITDLLSDIILLNDIKKRKSTYLQNQQNVQTKINSNEYIYQHCVPSIITSPFQSEIDSQCNCIGIDIFCQNIDAFHVEYTQTAIYNETDFNTANFTEIVNSSVSCEPYMWALDDSYKKSFKFSNWTCVHCDCIGNLYDLNTSIALLHANRKYQALYEKKTQFCDMNSLLHDNYNDHVDNLFVASIVFVIIGFIAQCIGTCGKGLCLKKFLKRNNNNKSGKIANSGKLDFYLQIFATGFMVSLCEDVPQTVIAMYYSQFLYANNGYYCYESFSQYPDLQKMLFDPADSIAVILVENPSIFFSVAMSMITIIFKGIINSFRMYKIDNLDYSQIPIKFGFLCECCKLSDSDYQKYLALIIIIICSIIYILALLMPITAVAYFSIATSFNKTWIPSYIIFISGCITWIILFLYGLFNCFSRQIIEDESNSEIIDAEDSKQADLDETDDELDTMPYFNVQHQKSTRL